MFFSQLSLSCLQENLTFNITAGNPIPISCYQEFFITNINLFTEHKFLLVVSPIFPISIPISKLFLLVTSHFFSSEKFCPQYFISIPLPRAISPSWHSSFFQFPCLFLPDLINVSRLYLYFPDILQVWKIAGQILKHFSRIQAPVVQTSDSAIHRINHYPADSVIDFRNTYPLDGDLSGG